MNNFGNLLKFEFKKLKQRNIFKLIILCAIILPIITSLSAYFTVKENVDIQPVYKSYAAVNYVIENDFFGPTMIIIFALSTIIICEEFSKGTIKQLFTKPYKKDYHLLSKYIVVCCTVLLYSLIFVSISTLIFEVLYHFQNLNVPNEYLNQDISYSIPKFMILSIISVIPQFLFYIVILFFWGALTNNPFVMIIYGFLLVIIDNALAMVLTNTEAIPSFILNFNISVCCSNIDSYIFKEKMFEGANLWINIIVLFIYFSVFLSLGRRFFRNKEIQNI